MIKLKEECFICFGEDDVLLNPGCLCKSMKVHESCLTELCTTNRQTVCAVCKNPFNIVSMSNRRHLTRFQHREEVEYLHKIVPFIFLVTMYTLLLMVSFKNNQYFIYLVCIWAVICISYCSCIICDCRLPLM